MAAYLIANSTILDPAAYGRYRALVPAAIAAYGGRFLARGGEIAELEGEWSPKRVIIIEFDDLDTVKRFYDSPEYRVAREAREDAANIDIIAVAGV